MLLMAAAAVLGVRAARNRLPTWAARTLLAAGVLSAVVAAVLIHGVAVTAPLFAQSREVPSVVDSTPSSQYAAAVDRAPEDGTCTAPVQVKAATAVRTSPSDRIVQRVCMSSR